MRWILIDVALALLAIALLGLLVLRLWRKVKALSTTVAQASDTLAQRTDALAAAQAQGPLGQDPTTQGPPPPGVTGGSPAGTPGIGARARHGA